MRLDVRGTNLSQRQIAGRITELGTPVSRHVVSQLLRKHRYRKLQGAEGADDGPRPSGSQRPARGHRPPQGEYLEAGLPVISIDTKKKELTDDFDRDGVIDTQATIEVNDHDFGSMGSSTVIPHGGYDVAWRRE
jgi:hypothetical protein